MTDPDHPFEYQDVLELLADICDSLSAPEHWPLDAYQVIFAPDDPWTWDKRERTRVHGLMVELADAWCVEWLRRFASLERQEPEWGEWANRVPHAEWYRVEELLGFDSLIEALWALTQIMLLPRRFSPERQHELVEQAQRLFWRYIEAQFSAIIDASTEQGRNRQFATRPVLMASQVLDLQPAFLAAIGGPALLITRAELEELIEHFRYRPPGESSE